MTSFTRRGFLMGAACAPLAAACTNSRQGTGADVIDARVEATLEHMHTTYPNTLDIRARSKGMLVMPLVTKAGFIFGAAYGRGALLVGDATVDYYSATSGSVGFQIGAQQYAHVLFFMTDDVLQRFRFSSGWAADAEAEFALADAAGNLSAQQLGRDVPVVAVVFGNVGLAVGAALKGTKYNRIIP